MVTQATMANAPYIGYLPTGITHLGGRTQVFPLQNFENMNNAGMTLIGTGNPAPAYSVGQNFNPTAGANPYRVIGEAQNIMADTFNGLTSSNIDGALGAVTTQKNQLMQKYNSGNLDNNIKTVIYAHFQQLENLERQLNLLKASSGQLDPQTAYQRSAYLQYSAQNLINLSTTTIQAMEAQATQAAQGAGQAQDAQAVDGAQQNPAQNDQTSLEQRAQQVRDANIYTRAGQEDVDPQAVNAQYYNDMIDKLYDSMKGVGTDDEAFEEQLNKINKDNVLELMYYWNQKHPNESLMEMFMADADAVQKKQYGMKIAEAIKGAAADLGIDLSQDADMQEIQSEVYDSVFYINNSVADNYNKLIQKLLATANIDYQFSTYSIWSK